MATDIIYRLNFKNQLHLGRSSGPAQEGKLGLEKTETYIPADTLFSAICQMWSTFYDQESLTSFLNGYTQHNDALPLTLTSAFPFAGDVYLFPKPLTLRQSEDTTQKIKAKAQKKIKNLQFVSGNLFHAIISGHTPTFTKDNCSIAINLSGEEICPANSERAWITTEEKEKLAETLCPSNKNRKDELNIWTTHIRPRVTLGSRNSGSEIWRVQTVQFNTECGLWFAAQFDTDDTQQKFETLLRILADTGIGGERNAGYGAFHFTKTTLEMPKVETADHFVTLSPVSPKSPQQLAQLLTGNIAYTLNPLTGWISNTGTATRRKQVNMFTEGSVLHTSDAQVGRLVNTCPDNWEHPVYRYGYAWQIGIRGTSDETEV